MAAGTTTTTIDFAWLLLTMSTPKSSPTPTAPTTCLPSLISLPEPSKPLLQSAPLPKPIDWLQSTTLIPSNPSSPLNPSSTRSEPTSHPISSPTSTSFPEKEQEEENQRDEGNETCMNPSADIEFDEDPESSELSDDEGVDMLMLEDDIYSYEDYDEYDGYDDDELELEPIPLVRSTNASLSSMSLGEIEVLRPVNRVFPVSIQSRKNDKINATNHLRLRRQQLFDKLTKEAKRLKSKRKKKNKKNSSSSSKSNRRSSKWRHKREKILRKRGMLMPLIQ
ncbi:hypothetical protein HK102_009141, partial [Quaeritorhiza haematococci]